MTRDLNGLRVLNTRPLDQGRALSHAINAAGGVSIDLPALAIEPTSRDWLTCMPDLTCIDQALFVSPNAVNYYFTALAEKKITWPNSIDVIAVGQASADALLKWGIPVHHMPSIADSEHLLELDALQHVQAQTLLLVKGLGGRELITETLRSRGAQLMPLSVYRRVLPKTNKEFIHSLWREDAVDIILFTSQQAMHNLFTLFGRKAYAWLCSKQCLVLSPRLAQAATLLGMRSIVSCHHDDLLNTLKGLAHDHSQ